MANALTNTQIENYLKDYKRFKGCFFKDTLPEELEERCYYIVNIDDSDSGKGGTHWCVLYCMNPNYILWFCPFGYPPPQEIEDRFKIIKYNHKDIQDYESTACGYFCIAFIKFSYHMQDVKRAIYKFYDLFCKNTKKNDYVLCNMLNGFLNMNLEVKF